MWSGRAGVSARRRAAGRRAAWSQAVREGNVGAAFGGKGGGWRLGLVAGVLAAALFLSGALAVWERSFADWLFLAREWVAVTAGSKAGAEAREERVVVVAIDADSLARLGRWPWPRTVLADAITKIAESGARVIGLDILLTEPSPVPEDDAQLARSIREAGNVVLAAQADFSVRRGLELGGAAAADADLGDHMAVRGVYRPLALFAREAAGVGHVSFVPDRDGVVRKLPVGSSAVFGVPSFDEEVARLASPGGAAFSGNGGLHLVPIDFHLSRENGQAPGSGSPSAGRLGRVPADARVVPFWQILDDGHSGKEAREALRDSVVLVGMTAGGDNHFTPFRHLGAVPGVYLHAAAVDMLLAGRAVNQLPSLPLAVALLSILGGLGAGEVIRRADGRRHAGGLLAALGLSGAVVFLAVALFGAWNLRFTAAPALLVAFAVAYLLHLVSAIVNEEHEKRFWAMLLRRYVSDEVAEELVRHPEALGLGGRRAEVTVLFADLRGFTSFAEREEPERVVTTLNAYLGRMANEVLAAGGILDKFTGDGLLAVFGAIQQDGRQCARRHSLPKTSPPAQAQKGAAAALRAAKALVAGVESLNELRAAAGLTTLAVGVGLHSGTAVIGNVGSARRSDFTVVGDVVNVAARLVETAGPGEILVTGETLALAMGTGAPAAEAAAAADTSGDTGGGAGVGIYRGEMMIRGKSQPVSVWAVTPLPRGEPLLKCDPEHRSKPLEKAE